VATELDYEVGQPSEQRQHVHEVRVFCVVFSMLELRFENRVVEKHGFRPVCRRGKRRPKSQARVDGDPGVGVFRLDVENVVLAV